MASELFCPMCENLFYHKEIDKKLHLVCKNCGYKKQTNSTLVNRKVYRKENKTTIVNKLYLKYDVGYPRTTKKKCPNKKCPSDKSNQEAIFFSGQRDTKTNIYLYSL